MREHKYRAFDKLTNKLYPVNTIYFGAECLELEDSFGEGQLLSRTFQQVKLQEYTGLKDENDKEIYEGDIVKKGDKIYYISFSMGSFELRRKVDSDKVATGRRLYVDFMNIEVIGNIYENPELLK